MRPRGLDTEHGSSCRPHVAERACSCPSQCVFPRTGRGRPAPGAAVCGPLDSTLSSRITLTMTKTSIFHLLFDEMWDVIVPKIAQPSDWTGKEPRVEGQILSHHSRCWPRPQEQPHLSKWLPSQQTASTRPTRPRGCPVPPRPWGLDTRPGLRGSICPCPAASPSTAWTLPVS